MRSFLRLGDGEVGYFADDPVEVGLAYGVQVCVGGGIHEVDGVGDAVFDGEFDGVEVVAEGLAELQGVLLDALEELPEPISGPPSAEVLDELRSERL